MSWTCKICNHLNPNVGLHCYYCKHHFGLLSFKGSLDKDEPLDESNVRNANYEIWKTEQVEQGEEIVETRKRQMPLTLEEINKNPNMSEKEKKFARFFALEKTLVINMDDSALRAHIEELGDIAFEARARLTSANDEAQERVAKKKRDKGFSTSVAMDDFTSDAINNIKERQSKMTKVEKEIEKLVALGISREDATNMYRATTINKVQKEGAKSVIETNKRADVNSAVNLIMNPNPREEAREFVNPFAAVSKEVEEVKEWTQTNEKQAEDRIHRESQETKVEILDTLDKVGESVKEVLDKKSIFHNPFAKKEE